MNVTKVFWKMLCLPAKHDAARAACEQGVVHPKKPARRRLLRVTHSAFAQWRPDDIKWIQMIRTDKSKSVGLASHKQGSSTDFCLPLLIAPHSVSICFVNSHCFAIFSREPLRSLKRQMRWRNPFRRQDLYKDKSQATHCHIVLDRQHPEVAKRHFFET